MITDRKESVPSAVSGEQTPAFRHLSKIGLSIEVTPLTDRRPIRFALSVTVSTDSKTADFKSFTFDTHFAIGAGPLTAPAAAAAESGDAPRSGGASASLNR